MNGWMVVWMINVENRSRNRWAMGQQDRRFRFWVVVADKSFRADNFGLGGGGQD
jgi:hypothetical protein